MSYVGKKEFDNFVMLYIERKVAMVCGIRYKEKCVMKDLILKTIVKISELSVLRNITYKINRNRRDMGAAFVCSMEAT